MPLGTTALLLALWRGSAKATLFYNQASPTVLDSYNVASVTDVSTGVFDPQYTNNMGSGNYSCSRMGVAVAANLDVVSYALYIRCTLHIRTRAKPPINTQTVAISSIPTTCRVTLDCNSFLFPSVCTTNCVFINVVSACCC